MAQRSQGGGAHASPSSTASPHAGLLTAGGTPLNGGQAFKVLEVFLADGLSHRDTLWFDEPGHEPGGQWRDLSLAAQDHPDSGLTALGYFSGLNLTTSSGAPVGMGPCVGPLRADPSLWDRTRLAILRHEFDPHGPAQAHSLTGSRAGRPGFAGLAARASAVLPSSTMNSWVIDTGVSASTLSAAIATGNLGAQHRPFVVPLRDPNFYNDFQRPHLASNDGLLDFLRDQYAWRLRPGPTSPRVRSAAFDQYDASVQQLLDWQAIHAMLPGQTLYGSQGNDGYTANGLTRGIEAAEQLLCLPDTVYVGVLSNGPIDNLDTHFGVEAVQETYAHHAQIHNGTLYGLFDALAASQIDFDNTLVVVHSEFGRAGPETDNDGTYHWPYGYPALLLGGPVVDSAGSGPTQAGTLQFGTAGAESVHGYAVGPMEPLVPLSPTDLMIGVMFAMGMDPFAGLLAPADTDNFDPTSLTPQDPPLTDIVAEHLFGRL